MADGQPKASPKSLHMSPDRFAASMTAPFFREVERGMWTVQDQMLRGAGVVRRNGRRFEVIRDPRFSVWHGSFVSRRAAGEYLINYQSAANCGGHVESGNLTSQVRDHKGQCE